MHNRYQITHKLGEGGMGLIYQANDQNLNHRQCVIKTLSPQYLPLAELQEALPSFRREGDILATLHHPGLPEVYDRFEAHGEYFLVMEFIEGETLEAILARNQHRPLPLPEVLRWITELGEILTYLHSQTPPIIYRDLKPGNVMITPQGRTRLIDFGIARFFVSGKANDTQNFGTLGYAAPEQYGSGQTGAYTDVYALGVLLHELSTGYDPAQGRPFSLPPARQVNTNLSPELAEVIQKATQPEAATRFQSVPEFLRALPAPSTPFASQPTPVSPPPTPLPLSQHAPSKRAPAAPYVTSSPQFTPKNSQTAMTCAVLGGLGLLLPVALIIGWFAFDWILKELDLYVIFW